MSIQRLGSGESRIWVVAWGPLVCFEGWESWSSVILKSWTSRLESNSLRFGSRFSEGGPAQAPGFPSRGLLCTRGALRTGKTQLERGLSSQLRGAGCPLLAIWK